MANPKNDPQINWQCIEFWHWAMDDTIGKFMGIVPDANFLQALQVARGKGRNEYPIPLLWRIVLLTILQGHASVKACLANLDRKRHLRTVLGWEPGQKTPQAANISRFLELLGSPASSQHLQSLTVAMIQGLATRLTSLGRRLEFDIFPVHVQHSSRTDGSLKQLLLPQPQRCRMEVLNSAGQVAYIEEWFGYALCLLVDRNNEVVLGYRLVNTTEQAQAGMLALMQQAIAILPTGRIRSLTTTLSGDSSFQSFLKQRNIAEEPSSSTFGLDVATATLPGGRYPLHVLTDDMGIVYCEDRTGELPVRHRMAKLGYERERHANKYGCPARHQGWPCPSDALCNRSNVRGLTVRYSADHDAREEFVVSRIMQVASAREQGRGADTSSTKKLSPEDALQVLLRGTVLHFRQQFRESTAIGRLKGRLTLCWRADSINLVGAERVHAWLGTVMVVHLGLATLLAEKLGQPSR